MLLLYIVLAAVISVGVCLSKGLFGMELIGSAVLGFLLCLLAEILLHIIFVLIATLPVDTTKKQEKYSSFFSKLCSVTAKLGFDLLNVKIRIEGEELLPKERFLLIQNHRTLFDPLVSIYSFGKYQLAFVTKPENMKLPVIGKVAHKLCCLPIDRENARNAVKTINEAAEYIKNDVCSVGIYPEGTRNKVDEGLLPFRNGAFKIAVKANCPLVVTAISGVDDIFKNAPFKRTNVTVTVCGVFTAEEVKTMKTFQLAEESRKMLCEALSVPYIEAETEE